MNHLLSISCGALAFLSIAGCGGGGGGSSGNSTTATPSTPTVTVPGAPGIGAATAGNASASIAFTAPASNGGAAISSYTATCLGAAATVTSTSVSSPIIVGGLANLNPYSCSVTAANSAGTGAASAAVGVTPSASSQTGISTAAILCPYSQTTANITLTTGVIATSTSSWVCSGTQRTLTANGLPNHVIGTFPNAHNPTAPTPQVVNFSATLTPFQAAANGGARQLGYALNGVKFDPGTGGTCPSTATTAADCDAIGTDTWRLEALGQTFFSFGTDMNNAHVQPTGAYHYHGMPEGLLTYLGVTNANPGMALIGWAPDGHPIYARYGRTVPTDGNSALKVIRASYAVKSTPDAGRPSTTSIPMGVFLQDWQYVAGSGDLDDCNGRFDVTPEFPGGIYHYYATDTWPYFPRCWKGVVN